MIPPLIHPALPLGLHRPLPVPQAMAAIHTPTRQSVRFGDGVLVDFLQFLPVLLGLVAAGTAVQVGMNMLIDNIKARQVKSPERDKATEYLSLYKAGIDKPEFELMAPPETDGNSKRTERLSTIKLLGKPVHLVEITAVDKSQEAFFDKSDIEERSILHYQLTTEQGVPIFTLTRKINPKTQKRFDEFEANFTDFHFKAEDRYIPKNALAFFQALSQAITDKAQALEEKSAFDTEALSVQSQLLRQRTLCQSSPPAKTTSSCEMTDVKRGNFKA